MRATTLARVVGPGAGPSPPADDRAAEVGDDVGDPGVVEVHADGVARVRVELQQHAGLAAGRLGAADLDHEAVVDEPAHDGGDRGPGQPGRPGQLDAADLPAARMTSRIADRLLACAAPDPAGCRSPVLLRGVSPSSHTITIRERSRTPRTRPLTYFIHRLRMPQGAVRRPPGPASSDPDRHAEVPARREDQRCSLRSDACGSWRPRPPARSSP